MATNNGIDYGLGVTNVDPKTGIRYGVIHQNECLQAWADSSEPYYGEEAESWTESEWDGAEPLSWYVDDGEYSAESDEQGDIFILKSPYYTLCAYCSPCAPGAGYLTSEGNVKAYCLGHDWFDSGKAPYKVFRVSDNSEVTPN